jgi:hypothetical protein
MDKTKLILLGFAWYTFVVDNYIVLFFEYDYGFHVTLKAGLY